MFRFLCNKGHIPPQCALRNTEAVVQWFAGASEERQMRFHDLSLDLLSKKLEYVVTMWTLVLRSDC